MVRGGKIVFSDTLDQIKAQYLQAALLFEIALAAPPMLEGVLHWEGSGREWLVTYRGPREQIESTAARIGARVVACQPATLDDIFVASIGAPQSAAAPEPASRTGG
jgi:hypothetical protein